MNEQLQQLLQCVGKTAGEFADTASDAAYGVKGKAWELASVAKLNIRAAENKADIDYALREVGEMIYATHTGTPTDSDVLLEKLQEIDRLHETAAAIQAEIGRLRGEKAEDRCPTCGARTQAGDSFCRECGGKLEKGDQ
ncbi:MULTISPECIES: zinc ribbon domain-containing protein [environmental samples]|uniref:zinc ribbon domain-containing protein n=1 Tax=environmental samples TaxID=876090 RepID=UPI00033577BD|nr:MULTISPECIES: zinc ribbon domain-containing protein [environmental samples]CDC68441.1 putative uncharacterized protein [Oscillibacter sp. CAG:155]